MRIISKLGAVALAAVLAVSPATLPAQSADDGGTARFAFVDLVSDRPVRARTFYRDLFGWRFENSEVPTEQVITHRGHQIGRLVSIADLDPQKVEGQWIPVLSVPSVDNAHAAARGAGGRVVVAPTDDAVSGRYSVVRDPGGAVLTLFDGEIPSAQPQKTGLAVWLDLFTSGVPGAERFYDRVAGLKTIS